LLTINALCTANSVFIPLQCEYYALEGLSQLLRTIGLVRDNLNPNLEIEGVFLTMADYRTNLTHEVINEARNYFSSEGKELTPFSNKVKVYETVIPRNIRLTEAPSFGKPIALYDGSSLGAQKYQELSRELLGVSEKSNNIKVTKGS
jgi:chromosome partitioning protein